ncbi:U3 snoRNP-associated protein Utp11 [Schizosaccharomyces japonicus yFS275]|uniref:U3 small nucleolar RNA-associated protein 11 n=1 Tax=Schizosaccharomyces japonicus (strain yFS275 / FY16936) TaxID=402676 RepID=B6JZI5_SCHJY|nr:U3 snoRNP-associated protein Utp11 [Schizosaccharomyces japonicus yFS275]EEB06953.1 U3 snoRNP-associated protein Utp11 [Schizosaccharomyces japonicus yFS275]
MSSMRNAVQRRNHKERSQPYERKKFGLLEKKKDYLQRAQDYKTKQKKLKRLREKALERNPDEFYYEMVNKKTKDGVPITEREDSTINMDAIKILKTQDAGWIRMHREIEQSKIEQLESQMHTVGALRMDGERRKHTLFVDTEDEARTFDPAEHFNTYEELLDRTENRLRADQLEEGNLAIDAFSRRLYKKEKEKAAKELLLRKQRDEKLKLAEEKTQVHRLLQGKGGRRKVTTSSGKQVYKWRNERKK